MRCLCYSTVYKRNTRKNKSQWIMHMKNKRLFAKNSVKIRNVPKSGRKSDPPSGLAADALSRSAFGLAYPNSLFLLLFHCGGCLNAAAKPPRSFIQAPATVPFAFAYLLRFLFFYAIIYYNR